MKKYTIELLYGEESLEELIIKVLLKELSNIKREDMKNEQ